MGRLCGRRPDAATPRTDPAAEPEAPCAAGGAQLAVNLDKRRAHGAPRWCHDIRNTLQRPGSALQMRTVLAAAAAAWALGITPELVGAGIETYDDSVARATAAT